MKTLFNTMMLAVLGLSVASAQDSKGSCANAPTINGRVYGRVVFRSYDDPSPFYRYIRFTEHESGVVFDNEEVFLGGRFQSYRFSREGCKVTIFHPAGRLPAREVVYTLSEDGKALIHCIEGSELPCDDLRGIF